MENSELQKIWKKIDNGIDYKSTTELNLLLRSKAKQTLNKYLVIIGISIIVSVGLLVYLVITSVNRHEDVIYLINNISLGIITVISLISGLYSWRRIQNSKFNLPLKEWLNERINMLSQGLTGKFSKLYLFLIPLLLVLIVLSIHVYFENQTFLEVMKTEESVIGLIMAVLVGLFVSYFTVRQIRKYQLQNLGFLQDLYKRLCNIQ